MASESCDGTILGSVAPKAIPPYVREYRSGILRFTKNLFFTYSHPEYCNEFSVTYEIGDTIDANDVYSIVGSDLTRYDTPSLNS
jgi:hypothetical protein